MRRRHLFDKGYPVTRFTLVAGSQVLLAVARHALRTSRQRVGTARLLVAQSSERLIDSLALAHATRAELYVVPAADRRIEPLLSH
jgi:hypothetical protein